MKKSDIFGDKTVKQILEENLLKVSSYKSSLNSSDIQFFESIPTRHQLAYVKAKTEGVSARKAARLNCIHCCGWNLEEAKRCVANTCPMFEYKPK